MTQMAGWVHGAKSKSTSLDNLHLWCKHVDSGHSPERWIITEEVKIIMCHVTSLLNCGGNIFTITQGISFMLVQITIIYCCLQPFNL